MRVPYLRLCVAALLAAAGMAAASDEACPYCPDTVSLSPGSFWLGSSPEALDRQFLVPDRVKVEQPRQWVTIAYPFSLSQTEVTRGEYAAFSAATERTPTPCLSFDFAESRWLDQGYDWMTPGFEQSDAHPVVCVSWLDAQAYVRWLSEQTGERYRLPSEAEWEYAARAGTQTLWPWGDDLEGACEYINGSDRSGVTAGVSSGKPDHFDCDDGYAYTAPADFGEANDWGLIGMLGNAGEWTADCLHRSLVGAPTDGAPRFVPDCRNRVMRGGSWFNPPMYNRPAFRYGTGQAEAYNLVGFRLLREHR